MKKTFAILTVVAVLFSVTCCADVSGEGAIKKTIESASRTQILPETPRNLTYEEIMRLPTGYGSIIDYIYCSTFDEYLQRLDQSTFEISFVCGEVMDVHHYLTWNGDAASGLTVSTLRITNIDSSYNRLDLSVGDIIQVVENYYISFADPVKDIEYFAEKSGINNSAQTNGHAAQVWADLEAGIQEIVPVQGGEYKKYFSMGDVEIPMGIGKRYTFAIAESGQKVDGFEKLYNANWVFCVGMTDTDQFLSDAQLENEPHIRMIAEEIYKRFDFENSSN